MPAPPPSGYAYGQPSCWTRMKTGFMIGFCVGIASGALFGGFSALRSVYQILYAQMDRTHILFFNLCCHS